MKSNIENEVLTIFLEGEINSSNAEEVEQELEAILNKGGFKSVKIDFGDVNYVSSAGLRITVRVKQKYDVIALVNVPEEVFEIFEMVGFQNLFKIEKK